jgi:cyclophilin family peptidyl-prolyl cis-trans isomerase/HEAT repeat protein
MKFPTQLNQYAFEKRSVKGFFLVKRDVPSIKAKVFVVVILATLSAEGARRGGAKSPARKPSHITTEDTLQKILLIEDRRIAKDPVLVQALRHPSGTVRKAALRALGRIGDNSGLDEMARILTRKDVEMRLESAFALSLIPDDNAGKILSQNFPMHKEQETRAALLENMGRTGNESTVRLLAETLATEPTSRLFPSIYESLGLLWSRDSENWAVPPGLLSQLARAAQTRGNEATLAGFALARFKGPVAQLPADELVQAGLNAPNEVPKAFLARVLGKIRTPASLAALIKGAANPTSLPVRIESVKSIGSHDPTPESLAAISSGFNDPYQHVVFESLIAAGKLGGRAVSLSTPILGLWNNSRSPWIKGLALKTLAHVDPRAARAEVTRVLANPASPNFTDAILALGILGEAADVQQITLHLTSPDLPTVAAAAEAMSLLESAKIPSEAQNVLKGALDKADANVTTVIAQMATQHQWKDFAPALVAHYPKLNSVDHLEAKIAALTALGALGDTSVAPFVLAAVSDKEKLVVEAAVKSYKALTQKDLSDKIPLNSKVEAPAPLLSAVQSAVRMRVALKTTRGEIHLKMLAEAPLTAFNFVRLVRSGFYQNKTFHRVVPNFVVQGGDPRGDGFGGPGYFIRDEVSRRKHERGTVGIATAGKDTGGSQFFFNLAPNFHLNGRYTVFAEITQGMAVADRLEVGDKILSARAY